MPLAVVDAEIAHTEEVLVECKAGDLGVQLGRRRVGALAMDADVLPPRPHLQAQQRDALAVRFEPEDAGREFDCARRQHSLVRLRDQGLRAGDFEVHGQEGQQAPDPTRKHPGALFGGRVLIVNTGVDRILRHLGFETSVELRPDDSGHKKIGGELNAGFFDRFLAESQNRDFLRDCGLPESRLTGASGPSVATRTGQGAPAAPSAIPAWFATRSSPGNRCPHSVPVPGRADDSTDAAKKGMLYPWHHPRLGRRAKLHA
jgi:hypothetical protein